jgi:integrase/recombinase XerD
LHSAHDGNASIPRRRRYAEIDLEMKAKALARCEVKDTKRAKKWQKDVGLMTFLRSL